MGFYRIIKMIFRDILFKIPKKYLVVIIVLLIMFILKTNVFAYSNYDYIPTDSPAVDCIFYDESYIYWNKPYDLHLEQNLAYNSEGIENRYTFYFEIRPQNKTSQYDLLSYPGQAFRLYYQYSGSYTGFMLNLGGNTFYLANINDFDITQDISIQIVITETNSISIVSQGNITRQVALNFGSTYFNEDGTSNLILAGVGTSPFIKNVLIYTANLDSDYYVDLCNIYPCKYLDTSTGVLQYIPGSYDIVTGLFTYFDQWRFNESSLMAEPPPAIQDYAPPTPEPTPTPDYIDYTNNLDSINNSIDNMNNFLQNDNIDNSIVDISSPNVSNSEISNVSDGGFSSIFSIFTNALDNNSDQSIDIYIPNFITGGGTKFITIHSNLVRNAISNTSVIPGTNFTILNLVELIWTALFGYWFIIIITGFVNMIYSGSLISDSSLQKLSSTYTGVTGSML